MRELAQQLLKGVHLDKGHVLGEGAYGVVYRGLLGDSPVALKAIKAHSPEQQMELEAALLDEAAAWTTVHHPNVVQCYGLHKDASGSLYLVSELMDGSVEALLQEEAERIAEGEEPLLTERQKLTMVLHVACALQRLHQLAILHADLAARNVLYRRAADGSLALKVADFGLATVGKGAAASKSYQLVQRRQLPVRWCAPEVLRRNVYSAEGDVWSLGVYAWEVFALGDLPYGAHTANKEIVAQITPVNSDFRLTAPDGCPAAVTALLASCWAYGRKQRITLDALEKRVRNLRDQREECEQSPQQQIPTATAAAAAAPINLQQDAAAVKRQEKERATAEKKAAKLAEKQLAAERKRLKEEEKQKQKATKLEEKRRQKELSYAKKQAEN